MCVVSMVADHYNDRWGPVVPMFPGVWPNTPAPIPALPALPFYPSHPPAVHPLPISREEFEALKRDMAEMKELLKRAKAYDAKNNEPNCDMAEKVEALRKLAAVVGISLDDVFGAKPA